MPGVYRSDAELWARGPAARCQGVLLSIRSAVQRASRARSGPSCSDAAMGPSNSTSNAPPVRSGLAAPAARAHSAHRAMSSSRWAAAQRAGRIGEFPDDVLHRAAAEVRRLGPTHDPVEEPQGALFDGEGLQVGVDCGSRGFGPARDVGCNQVVLDDRNIRRSEGDRTPVIRRWPPTAGSSCAACCRGTPVVMSACCRGTHGLARPRPRRAHSRPEPTRWPHLRQDPLGTRG